MAEIKQERQLWQWDLNRRLEITGIDNVDDWQVHFSMGNDGTDALVVLPSVGDDGRVYAAIPNILLQRAGTLYVYLFDVKTAEKRTSSMSMLTIMQREKPADYVYTETQLWDWQAIDRAEDARDSAEAERISAETARSAAEAARISAEADRISAEAVREEQCTAAVSSVVNAAESIADAVTTDTFVEKLQTTNAILASMASNNGGLAVTSYKDIQRIVRMGLARQYFKIGDQISVTRGDDVLVWDVIGIDHDEAVDPGIQHTLTLQLHDLFSDNAQFDEREALYYFPSGLASGTYHFTLPDGYSTEYGGGKTYQFTLADSIPAGGQLCFLWNYNTQFLNAKISTYASASDTVGIETVSVSEGDDGTALPEISQTVVTEDTNCIVRARYGSNSWSASGIRQWLNSDGDAGTWWKPQTVFDRPHGNAGIVGFLNGMDADFVKVLCKVKKSTQKSVSDGYGMEETIDTVFLPSRAEVYAGVERSADGYEGDAYPYYRDYSSLSSAGAGTDINRIKYRNGAAKQWWLRTPSFGGGHSARGFNTAGGLNYDYATNSFGVAPACVIG